MDCRNDFCNYRLWDKRTANYFPGHTSHQQAQRKIVVRGECVNKSWQVCMNYQCATHQPRKEQNGFEENFFLDKNKELGLPVTPPMGSSDTMSKNIVASEHRDH
jgi:hypothetical protein